MVIFAEVSEQSPITAHLLTDPLSAEPMHRSASVSVTAPTQADGPARLAVERPRRATTMTRIAQRRRRVAMPVLAALIALAALASEPDAARAQTAAPAARALAWPAVTRETRPWTRWWWMGSAVDRTNLTRELQTLAGAGFGGVEVTSIYGVRGADSSYVPYLSDRWVGLLAHTVAEARRLGMGVDMPPGSGWRTGGPLVPEADANASLRVTVDSVRGGARWRTDRRPDAVLAVSDAGRAVEVARASAPGPVQWQAPAGSWTLYVAETRPSGDNVKRPAPGGEGFAIDVFSRAVTERFLTAYGARLAALPRGALRSYMHDSFEYTGTGSRELFDFFRRRRGYDLATQLPALLGAADADRVARVKSDYRQTIDEMLLEHFVRPLNGWAHARGSLSRNQAHGSPGNLLDLYAASDIPETEIFGPLDGADSDPLINKFASSAAHVAGRRLTSAEAFTWLGEHFSATLGDVKQAADELFLGGINHLIYHGTTYSPREAAWPGWLFYASAEFNPQNAFWRDLPAFNQYVTRVQSVLQDGRPDNDVLLYWPVWDSWHDTTGLRLDFRVHDPKWLHDRPVGRIAAALWNGGQSFDYLSDRLLAARVTTAGGRLRAGDAEYAMVLVPRTERMPPETLRRLLDLARGGATIAFVERLPGDVPGLARLDERRAALAAMVRELSFGEAQDGVRQATLGRGRVLVGDGPEALLAAAGVRREPMTTQEGVRLIRRRFDGGRHYFVGHAGREAIDGWVSLATPATAVALMDPMTGRVGMARVRRQPDGSAGVYLQLAPGASLVLRTFERATTGPAWTYDHDAGPAVALRGRWSVRFVEGGPALPQAFESDSLVPWTGRGDAEADRFAGTARYTLRFDAPDAAAEHVLELGRVAESARVRLNGRDLGTVFAAPFRLRTGRLQPTGNVLEIEVTNLSANRIRDLDVRKVPWKIFRDINYVGIDYRPFDASGWSLRPSGLLGPVLLRPVVASAPAA